MQKDENQQNRSQGQDSEQENNKAASGNIANNDAEQNAAFRENQNQKTKSSDASSDMDSLSNNERQHSTDSVPVEDRNKRKLESERDSDFGNEQLQ